MNFDREAVGNFSEGNFIRLLINGCAESLRIGALGDFCTILKYLILFSWNQPSHQSLFHSDRIRHFCFSNDSSQLTIGGVRVPALDPRFDTPRWSIKEFLCDLKLMLESTIDESISSLLLSELSQRESTTLLEDELTQTLKDLRQQDPDRHSMLLTLVIMFLSAEDDEREREEILRHDGSSFLFLSDEENLHNLKPA